MKRLKVLYILLSTLALIYISGCQSNDSTSPSTTNDNENATYVEGQYIVVFNEDKLGNEIQAVGGMKQIAQDFIRSYGINETALLNVYSHVLKGFCSKLTPEQLEAIKSDKRIAYIEQDEIISLDPVSVVIGDNDAANRKSSTIQSQTTPWGISRVSSTYSFDYGGSNSAWIVDTGIDQDHSDLNVDTDRSRTFVSSGDDRLSPDDLHGHGTHVAGTIAAINNDYGVVGVAAGATVVAVKVLNKNGSGYVSEIIAGLDYVYENAADGDVVNCSFGGGKNTSLDNAVSQFDGTGIYVCIAAGNSRTLAKKLSPARVNGTGIFTISAHDSQDRFASFSNYGNPPIDWCAPGVSVLSTYKNNQYATMSGTSMSTPHVAGILLANSGTINRRGYVSGDRDRTPDPLASR